MMFPPHHCEAALVRIAQITAVKRARPAITTSEALEQIAEELDLAGFGPADDEDLMISASDG